MSLTQFSSKLRQPFINPLYQVGIVCVCVRVFVYMYVCVSMLVGEGELPLEHEVRGNPPVSRVFLAVCHCTLYPLDSWPASFWEVLSYLPSSLP